MRFLVDCLPATRGGMNLKNMTVVQLQVEFDRLRAIDSELAAERNATVGRQEANDRKLSDVRNEIRKRLMNIEKAASKP